MKKFVSDASHFITGLIEIGNLKLTINNMPNIYISKEEMEELQWLYDFVDDNMYRSEDVQTVLFTLGNLIRKAKK